MTTYVISDLHYGLSRRGDAAVRALAAHLCRIGRRGDQLLIAGDIGSCDLTLVDCLGLFRGFSGTRMAIAGNHDVWVEPTEKRDSWERYTRLADMMNATGFHPLEKTPLLIGDRAFVGTMGWYDYSFRDEIGLPFADYERKRSSAVAGGWNDARYARLPYTDVEMTRMMRERLRKHLDAVNGCREVTVVMHHLPTKSLLFHPRWLVPQRWRFMNAFLGSDTFAGLLDAYPNIRHVFCGHVHRYKTVRKDGIRMTSNGGNYAAKMLLTLQGDRISRQTFVGSAPL